MTPVPWVSCHRRGRRLPAARPFPLCATDREGDEACAAFRFDAHENGALSVAARIGKRLAHVGGSVDGLAADFEDHVPGLEAEFGSDAVAVNLRDRDAFARRTGHLARRSK